MDETICNETEANVVVNIRRVQRVLAVVVVYRRQWEQVVSAKYLLDQLEIKSHSALGTLQFELDRLIIYDNSPLPMAMPLCDHVHISYKHNPENGGTRSAYDYTLAEAIIAGQEWILLLDQDTSLPDDYLASACNSLGINSAQNIQDIDVLLPRVVDQGRNISPARITLLGSIVPLTNNVLATAQGRFNLTGVASGSLIRTSALGQIPKLPSELWLDYVDHWIFHQLNKNGARVAFVDATLQHELSIMSMSHVSEQRLHSILNGELIFTRSLALPARLIYPIRFIARLVRMSFTCRPAAKNMAAWFLLRFAK
jgi:hypothetical protein